MASQCSDLTWTSNFFDLVLFLLLSLVTGPKFMSTSSLVLELWQFSFIRDWAEIWRSEIPSSEFCPISGDWSELWTPHLARMSLIECNWLLQNSRVTTFTIFELLRENQVGSKITPPPQHPVNPGLNTYKNSKEIHILRLFLYILVRILYKEIKRKKLKDVKNPWKNEEEYCKYVQAELILFLAWRIFKQKKKAFSIESCFSV